MLTHVASFVSLIIVVSASSGGDDAFLSRRTSCTSDCDLGNTKDFVDVECGSTVQSTSAVGGLTEHLTTTCAPPTLKTLNDCTSYPPLSWLKQDGPQALQVAWVTNGLFASKAMSMEFWWRTKENMIGKPSAQFDLSWSMLCPASSTTDNQAIRATYHFTLIPKESEPRFRHTPWVLGEFPDSLRCVVANEQSSVSIPFYHDIVGNVSEGLPVLTSWPFGFHNAQSKATKELPLFSSKPVPDSGLVQRIAGDVAQLDGDRWRQYLTVYLTITKAPGDTYLRKNVCVQPGDLYNYYPEVCMNFRVVSEASECANGSSSSSSPTTTSTPSRSITTTTTNRSSSGAVCSITVLLLVCTLFSSLV